MEILTAGICAIFRGLKSPSNNEIGENSHLWMGTSESIAGNLSLPHRSDQNPFFEIV